LVQVAGGVAGEQVCGAARTDRGAAMRDDEARDRTAAVRPTGTLLTGAQLERIRRSREALVDGGVLAAPPGRSDVPQHIERSWRRCVGERVPVAPDAIGYRPPDDVLPALHRAAVPVLRRLADSFADVPVAMVVSDATGRIVLRHVPVRRQRDIMDRASAAEGFDYSEPSVGTNGIGTVLVERRPVLVRGPEHYNTRLDGLTCASTPLFEPYTGRMVGTFSLTCALRDVHPLMTVLAGDIGRQIEGRILADAGDRRRHLVRAYLSVDRASGAALVVDEDTVLANRAGLAHTGPELHPLLWRFLVEHGPRSAQRMRVPLPAGPHDALVEPIDDDGRPAYTVRLLPGRRAAAQPAEIADPPDEPRGSRHSPGLMAAAERAAVAEALRAAGGNRSRAARALGIGRNTLYRKMREFGIG
jgi:transcriptional regulator of acetoin/glycerol metabolism